MRFFVLREREREGVREARGGAAREGERKKKERKNANKGRKSFLLSPELVLGLAVGDLVVAEPDADALELSREDAEVKERGGGGTRRRK